MTLMTNSGDLLYQTDYERRHGLEPVNGFQAIADECGISRSLAHKVYNDACKKLDNWREFLDDDPTWLETKSRRDKLQGGALMADIKTLTDRIVRFSQDREWEQFHTPGNLAKSISIESAELLEHFQWDLENRPELSSGKRVVIAQEIADIFIYLLNLCHELNIDLVKATEVKITMNENNYPVDKCKGKSTKHTEL